MKIKLDSKRLGLGIRVVDENDNIMALVYRDGPNLHKISPAKLAKHIADVVREMGLEQSKRKKHVWPRVWVGRGSNSTWVMSTEHKGQYYRDGEYRAESAISCDKFVSSDEVTGPARVKALKACGLDAKGRKRK